LSLKCIYRSTAPQTPENYKTKATRFGFSNVHQGQNNDQGLLVKLDFYVEIVRYQVIRYGAYVNLDDLYELYQEGLATLWEFLAQNKDINSPNEDYDTSVKRKVNSQLKKLRREQWKISKVSNEILKHGISHVTLLNLEEVENELNKICLQNALARLTPDESFAIWTKFKISSGSANVSKPRRKNISKRSLIRHRKNGLEVLSYDPEVRSLRLKSPASHADL
jgi:hypothetical protein